MYSGDEPFLRALECYFGIYFPRCFATREVNTKITLSWALERFVTRVQTLFSMYGPIKEAVKSHRIPDANSANAPNFLVHVRNLIKFWTRGSFRKSLS